MDEASKFIAANKQEAARIYIELGHIKTPEAEIMRMLGDPETRYSVAPNGTMKYAEFLNEIGRIKNKPTSWKDMFFPAVHDRPGS
jgi:NitT/TauT family transport system substrate-binding protein